MEIDLKEQLKAIATGILATYYYDLETKINGFNVSKEEQGRLKHLLLETKDKTLKRIFDDS